MVYLVGGYKLTYEQTLGWCHSNNIYPPESNISRYVNRWLRNKSIPTRLLACDYQGEPIFLVVTHKRLDNTGTARSIRTVPRGPERALSVKEEMKEMNIGASDVEFVTVPNPYG